MSLPTGIPGVWLGSVSFGFVLGRGLLIDKVTGVLHSRNRSSLLRSLAVSVLRDNQGIPFLVIS